MGQKVSPIVLRLGYIKNWKSRWFADKKEFTDNLIEDVKIRNYIKNHYQQAAVSDVIIERLASQIKIKICSARPGVIIGRRGADIERLRQDLSNMTPKEISLDIHEIKRPACDAQLIAQSIAFQLEKRVAFRRAMKRAIEQAMTSGGQGIKISCAGRLGGHEMARRETYKQGKLPLHTLRADIDYGFSEAHTTYGSLGVKVWIYNGDVITDSRRLQEQEKQAEPGPVPRGA